MSKDKKNMYPKGANQYPLNFETLLNLEMKRTLQIREARKPAIGKCVYKSAKSVMVCCSCYTEVIISGFTEKELPMYECAHSACPAYGKNRNKQQWRWMEYQQFIEYRNQKVIVTNA